MGAMHARVLRDLPISELVAVCDIDSERLREVAAELGVPAFRDYRELLGLAEVEAVSICLPDDMHRAPAEAAASAGKHVFLEKPLATTVEDGEAIVTACRTQGVTLMVAHLLRFDARYAELKRAIAQGRLGEISHIMAHRNSPWTEGPARYKAGTSLTLHVAVHDLDLINWYLEDVPVKVYARSVRKKLAPQRMDDLVSAIVEFEGGALATLQYSWALPPTSVTALDARLEVIGTDGMAIVGNYHGQAVFIASDKDYAAPDVHHGPILEGRVVGDLREELMAFLRCLQSGQSVPVSGEVALLAVREARAIEASIESGRPVEIVV